MALPYFDLFKLFPVTHLASALPENTALNTRIPGNVYSAGKFQLKSQGSSIVLLDNGVNFDFNSTDSDVVTFQNRVAKWDIRVDEVAGYDTTSCLLSFKTDGNLVMSFNGVPTWNTGTGGGKGAWLALNDAEPYLVIYDAAYAPIWHTPITPPLTPPKPVLQAHIGEASHQGAGRVGHVSIVEEHI